MKRFWFWLIFKRSVENEGYKIIKIKSWRTALVEHNMRSRCTITFYCFPWEY